MTPKGDAEVALDANVLFSALGGLGALTLLIFCLPIRSALKRRRVTAA